SHEPQVLSDGWQARVEVPSPEPWQILVVEPASANAAKVWAAEVEAEDSGFFDKRSVILRSRTPGAAIHYTTDNSEPTAKSPRYVRPLEIKDTTTLRARVFADGQASLVSSFTFTKRPANHIAADGLPAFIHRLIAGEFDELLT
ncbi:MAG: chitobiase/beta-hexosaminidase C-terminal domain-containing protein, partial [Planctomycetota bacterium]